MDLTFNTKSVNISVALKALKLYRDGDYKEAISILIEILDSEPANWQARLMLGVCYYKTEQLATAQRTFRYIYEKCTESEVKKRASEALLSTNARMQTHVDIPPEFGCYVEKRPRLASWLETITSLKNRKTQYQLGPEA